MKSGQLDEIITSYPLALHVTKKNTELWQLPEPLVNKDNAIAVIKGNEELLAAVNKQDHHKAEERWYAGFHELWIPCC